MLSENTNKDQESQKNKTKNNDREERRPEKWILHRVCLVTQNSSPKHRVPRAQICSMMENEHLMLTLNASRTPCGQSLKSTGIGINNRIWGQEKMSRRCWRNWWIQTGKPLTRSGMVGIREQEQTTVITNKGPITFAYLAEKIVAPYAQICRWLRTPYMNLDKFLYLVICFCTKQ